MLSVEIVDLKRVALIRRRIIMFIIEIIGIGLCIIYMDNSLATDKKEYLLSKQLNELI